MHIWFKVVYCMSRNVHFFFISLIFFFVQLTCLYKWTRHSILSISFFFFTKFTSFLMVLCFYLSSDDLKKTSDIFECFKLLNTGEWRGSVWCHGTEGTVLCIMRWVEEVKWSSVLRGNTLCLNSLSVQLKWVCRVWLVTLKKKKCSHLTPISKGRVFISPYSIMKLYNVKCFKGENINYLVPFKFLPE